MNPKWMAVPLLLAVFVGTACAADTVGFMDQENGPLENLQVLLLFLGFVFFMVPIRKAGRGIRCVLLAGALLCLSFIFRELDVEDLAVPQWVIAMGSGTGRNVIMAAGWAALGVLAIKSFSELKEKIKSILLSRTVVLLAIAALLLLSGEQFDHERIKVGSAQLWEEILETIGYFLMLVAAIFSRKWNREG